LFDNLRLFITRGKKLYHGFIVVIADKVISVFKMNILLLTFNFLSTLVMMCYGRPENRQLDSLGGGVLGYDDNRQLDSLGGGVLGYDDNRRGYTTNHVMCNVM